MEIVVTPITNKEIDLHSAYSHNPDNLKDLYWMRENKEQLDKTQMKLYSWLVFSLINF